MQDYPIDFKPEQVVRWLVAEQRTAPSKFKVVATRHAEPRELPTANQLPLGDEGCADLSETVMIATLQIALAVPGVRDKIDPSIFGQNPLGEAMGST